MLVVMICRRHSVCPMHCCDGQAIIESLESGSAHPGELKRDLARRVVEKYHGDGSGGEAEAAFDRLFVDKHAPQEVPRAVLPTEDPVWLPKALAEAGLVASNGEARRLIKQGAVKIEGTRFEEESISRSALLGATVQVGKRRFVIFTDS